MALKGTLKDFSVSDIFQLVSQQQKTGVLSLASEGEKAQVAFDNGMVVMAGSDLKRMDDLLGQRLVRSGLVSQEQLDECLALQRSTLQMLGQILMEKGYLERDALRKALLLQVQEGIYKLVGWREGSYDFEAQEVKYDKGLYTPLSTEYLLMEGHRILDEWPAVRKIIPTTDLVLRVGGRKTPEGAGLSPEQEKVLQLVDGARSVQRIADISLLGEFEATKALSDILNKGFIEPVPEAPAARPARKPFNLKDAATNIVSFALIAVVVILILSYASSLSSRKFRSEGGRQAVTMEHSLEALGHGQWERIRSALELYDLEHGGYPESLEDLVSSHILRRDELTYPWGKMYYYKKRNGDYILFQPKR